MQSPVKTRPSWLTASYGGRIARWAAERNRLLQRWSGLTQSRDARPVEKAVPERKLAGNLSERVAKRRKSLEHQKAFSMR